MKNSFYQDFIIYNIPRALTQIDRDYDSVTFGSCDRNYWHLKIRDFSSAILQQNVLTLAVIYSTEFHGNCYYKINSVLLWAKGIMDFWSKIQLRDGSFNEYYPNEHAVPPTAFSLFAVAEAYKRLNINDSVILSAMEKASLFLIKNHESKACNQEIASIAGLYSYYSISNENWILKGLNKKLNKVLEAQSDEGWVPEYGGADLGYLSVSFDLLAEYYHLSRDEKVLSSLEKMIDFISYFCHPDGTYGGEYGSRNTLYLLPNGIETMIDMGNSIASSIKNHIFRDEPYNNFHNAIDDRYFTHYVLHSFARSLEKEINRGASKCKDDNEKMLLPCYKEHCKFFNGCGLLTFKENNIYGIFSLKKGGTVKIFKDDKEIFYDYGYRYFVSGSIATTNWLDDSYSIDLININAIKIYGYFNLIRKQISSPFNHILLRIISSVFGKLIIGILKRKLIFINKHTGTYFKRNIKICDEKVIIKDEIHPDGTIINLHSSPVYSLRHVASGNFFHSSELLEVPAIKIKKVTVPILVTHEINLKNEKIQLDYEELH